MNRWMNDEAVYRTAPATPDLLKRVTQMSIEPESCIQILYRWNYPYLGILEVFVIFNRPRDILQTALSLADLGEARGCSWLIKSVSQSVSLFLPQLYGAATPKRLEMTRLCHIDQELSKSRRESKSLQWYKIYGHFTEGVDLAYWWSFSGGGSALQPAQQACFFFYKVVSYLVEDL